MFLLLTPHLVQSACQRCIHLTIDLSRPENQKPDPNPDEGEIIETFSLPLRGLHGRLRALEQQGFGINGTVGCFAHGIEMARVLGL